MTEYTQAANGSDDSGGQMVSGIIDSGSDATQEWVDWGQSRTENLKDPCGEAAELTSFYSLSIHPKWNNIAPLPEQISGLLNQRVNQVIDSQGRHLSSTVGGVRLSQWLIDRGTIPATGFILLGGLIGGPLGALIAAGQMVEAVDDMLPPSGAPSGTNSGTRLAGTSHVYYHQGSLRGSELRSAYWTWRRQMQNNVAPSGHNLARNALLELVGRGRPLSASDHWRVWKPGDPVNPTGKWAQMRDTDAAVAERIDDASERCQAKLAWEQWAAEQGIELQQDQLDALAATERARQTTTRLGLLAVAAAVGLIAFAPKGRKKK